MTKTTTAIPKRINSGWIRQKQTLLDCTRRTVDGAPNPSYEELSSEINAARVELEQWAQFESWVKSSLGAILNKYPLRIASTTHDAGKVFFRKDAGVTTFWTIEQAWQKYQEQAYIEASATYFNGPGEWDSFVAMVRAARQLRHYRCDLFDGPEIKVSEHVDAESRRVSCNADIYRHAIAAMARAKTMADVQKIIAEVDEIQDTDEHPCLIKDFSKEPQ